MDDNIEPKIAIVGAGSWGTTVAKMVAETLTTHDDFAHRDPSLKLYVHNDDYQGRSLTELINRYHINIKYLPGTLLPEIIHASGDLAEVIRDASTVLLVSPHAHVPEQCRSIRELLSAHQRENLLVLSLSKGLWFDRDTGHLWRMSEIVSERLGLPASRVGALSGPNVAREIANGHFTETVIASQGVVARKIFRALLERPYFAVRESSDIAGVEFGGALKNIVAIAAGLVDGYEVGSNAKASLVRIGMEEMYRFAGLPEFATSPNRSTVAGPAILGDVVTTCYAGRNRRYGEMLGRSFKFGQQPLSVQDFSSRVLGGQVVEGYETARDVHAFLEATDRSSDFPVFDLVFDAIEHGSAPMSRFYEVLHGSPG